MSTPLPTAHEAAEAEEDAPLTREDVQALVRDTMLEVRRSNPAAVSAGTPGPSGAMADDPAPVPGKEGGARCVEL